MKKHIFFQTVLLIFLSVFTSALYAQKSSEKVKGEITETLTKWNAACKNANIDLVMSMLDTTDGLMVVGSDKGEINKGKDEVKAWLSQLFGFAGFSWEMNRVDIDSNGKTAWVFMDGKMIVNFHKGGQKVTPYRFTGILIKKKDGWKWRLFDGSVPQGE
jgi:ketosteroid isomerase-like protein